MCKMPCFRERLNELFKDSGKTIIAFAEFLGTSRQSLGYYLNGDRIPDALMVKQICERCHVSADWLLGLSAVKKPDADLQAVCKYLWPLSAGAIRFLHWPKGIDELQYGMVATVNLLLETDEGQQLLHMLSVYLKADFSNENSVIHVHSRDKKEELYYSIPFAALQFSVLEDIKEQISVIRERIESNEISIGGFYDAQS